MGEERVVLEHGVDVALVRRHALGGLAEDLDMPLVGLLEAGDQPQASGLAGAGGAKHGEELAFADVEGDAVGRPDVAEMARDVDEFDG